MSKNRNKKIFKSFLMLIFLIILNNVSFNYTSAVDYETVIRCNESWQVVFSSETVIFNLEVRNQGPEYDSYLIYIDDNPLPDNWTANFFSGNKRVREIGINPSSISNLVLQVDVPSDARSGDYHITVYLNGTNSNAKQELSVTVQDIPDVTYQVELQTNLDWQVTYPGTKVIFNIQVKNLSPYTDSYFLMIDNPSLPENWTASFFVKNKKVKTFSLASEEVENLVLELEVSEDAESADHDFRFQIIGNHASETLALTVTVESIPREIRLLSPYRTQTLLAGQTVYYPIEITNNGKQNEEIFLNLGLQSDLMLWDISFSEDQISLSPGESFWVRLNVVPPGIVTENSYNMNITASSKDGEITSTIDITTIILADYLLEITGVQPINPQVSSGENVEVIVTVRNLGQSVVTGLKLTLNSTGISNILVTPSDVLALEPKANVDFFIRISPNSGITPGDYLIETQAQSAETKSSIRQFAVSIISPIPWFWISIGISVVATALVMLLIQRLIRRTGLKVKKKR
jgi:uncharacterized membrane protein